MERLIARALQPISRRLRLLASRAVIRLVNDGLKEQGIQLQLLAGEVGTAERYQHYGFTSHPHADSEAIVLSIGGSRDHLVTIADGDRRYRLKSTAQGEVALYDDQGQVIHLKRDKHVHIYGTDTLTADVGQSITATCPLIKAVASTKVICDTPLVECTGGITAQGAILSNTSVSDPNGSMQNIRSDFNAHTHHENDQGGETNNPTQQM